MKACVQLCFMAKTCLLYIYVDILVLKLIRYTQCVCVCVYENVCKLMHAPNASNVSLSLSTTFHSCCEQDMDHHRSSLGCCCSVPDNSVQLDHRRCSCSPPQLASLGDKCDNYPKHQALLFIPY